LTTVSQERISNHEVARQISNMVGALSDPVIYHKGQNLPVPDWIKEAITIERLLENLKANKEKREPTGTLAECAWYLSTASLEAPFDSDWTEIYAYCFTKTYEAYRSNTIGKPVPDDIRQDTLNNYQMMELNDLRRWIYSVRAKHRLESDITERRQKKEEAKNEKVNQNPTLFDFFSPSET